MAASQGIWRLAMDGAQVRGMTFYTEEPAHAVAVQATLFLPKVNAEWQTTYTVHPSGDLVVSAQFRPGAANSPKLPRLGMQMALPPGFEQITWLGRGPQATYCDREDARVGLFSGTVSQQFWAAYTEPGESGNKTGVRWAALKNEQGVGLLAAGLPLLSLNALHYTTDDLQSAKHSSELPRRAQTVLNLDLRQQGAGGDDSWGAWPHDQFMIPGSPASYRFRLRPFTSSEDVAKLARQRF